jgi:hypothetical protein
VCGDCVCVSFVACGKTVAYECQVPNPISNVSMQQQSWYPMSLCNTRVGKTLPFAQSSCSLHCPSLSLPFLYIKTAPEQTSCRLSQGPLPSCYSPLFVSLFLVFVSLSWMHSSACPCVCIAGCSPCENGGPIL